MKYLHVAGKTSLANVEYDQAILRQSGLCLYSLIGGMRQKDFGFHTLNRELKNIHEYKNSCVTPVGGELYIDSGGYSIIKGDVHPLDIPRFIECYDINLIHERDHYEYVFSLDIPLSTRYTKFNQKKLIYEYNLQSLKNTKEIIESFPQIADKLYFIWQFKILDQFDIWQKIYDELGLNKVIKNYALGGMVGLREKAKIDYSPFIPMAFKCLRDWETGGLSKEFRLHFLGMYIPYDRFQIALLEKLFRRYLGKEFSVVLTYDSVNYSHTVRFNKDISFFVWRGNGLEIYDKPSMVPLEVRSGIYNTQWLQQEFQNAVSARSNGLKIKNTNTFAPLNIYSNKCLDAFFEDVVDAKGFVDKIYDEDNILKFEEWYNDKLKSLAKEYPTVFTPRMLKSIEKNLVETFVMHDWRQRDGSPELLEELVVQGICDMKFPFRLI